MTDILSPPVPPSQELQAFFGHMARLLNSPDGQDLLEYLEACFSERRQVITEQTGSGTIQRVARMSSYSDNPYETARREGNREVVMLLKDLQEWQG